MADPYLPPSAPIDALPAAAKCPRCGNTSSTKVTFTFWGGLLGPKLFKVVRCSSCRKQYNGMTGASLTGVIVAYQVSLFVLAAGIGLAYFLSTR